MAGLEDKIALLVRYGAVDEPPLWQAFQQARLRGRWVPGEYRGWTPGRASATDGPVASGAGRPVWVSEVSAVCWQGGV